MIRSTSFFIFLFTILLVSNGNAQTLAAKGEYVCLPCGSDCDKALHDKPGTCSHCGMALVKKTTVKHTTIQPEKLCSYIASHPATILLDVRTKKEFDERSFPNYGSLKNSINIPIQELEKRISELDAYKNKEIIVFCSHSHRSPEASYMLTQRGFSKVINMAGGLSVLEDETCRK